jgi:hypothetical protein
MKGAERMNDDHNDRTSGEEEINDAFDQAEPPPGSLAWAKMIIDRYEPLLHGPKKEITKVYELPYVDAAAICLIDDPGYYDGLHRKLKGLGVRVGNWGKCVHDAERRIRQQRQDAEKAEARRTKAARGMPRGKPRPRIDIVPGLHPAMVDRAEQILVATPKH